MLIKIPDEYEAMETLLRRNGIPFEIFDEEEVVEWKKYLDNYLKNL